MNTALHGEADAEARLFGAVQSWLASRDETLLRPFIDPLQQVERRRRCERRNLPVLAWLDDLGAGATDQTSTLVQALVTAAPAICWSQTYTVADLGRGFLERYGWTELAGQRGPFHSDEVATGLLLLGPGTDYPAHRHAAEEVYIVLSGTACWQRGDVRCARPPGTLIHHPSMTWHGVSTSSQPLLALYLWRGGDLTQKSEIQPGRTSVE